MVVAVAGSPSSGNPTQVRGWHASFRRFPTSCGYVPTPTLSASMFQSDCATTYTLATVMLKRGSSCGRPRSSSVFPAPQRSLLECANFAEASARSRSRFGKGISRQAFNIYDKVRDVDALMTPDLQKQVVEVHPEVTFQEMNGGQPLADSKKTLPGFDARRTLLASTVTRDIPTSRTDARRLVPKIDADDLLDAFAAAWTAHRVATGDALRLPEVMDIDDRGLRMEIVR